MVGGVFCSGPLSKRNDNGKEGVTVGGEGPCRHRELASEPGSIG